MFNRCFKVCFADFRIEFFVFLQLLTQSKLFKQDVGPGVVCETSMHTRVEIQFALVHTFDMIHTNIVI